MTFWSLPNELIFEIANLLSLESLSRLVRTSRPLAELLLPVLYRRDGKSAFGHALEHGHVGVVRHLFALGLNSIDLTKLGENGGNALHTAARYGHVDVLRVVYERANKPTSDVASRTRRTPTTPSAGTSIPRTAWLGKFLEDCPVNTEANGTRTYLEAEDRGGRTALHHAAANGHFAATEFLLEAGALVDRRVHITNANAGEHQSHETHRRALVHEPPFYEEVDDWGNVVYMQDDLTPGLGGETALHLAAYNGHLPVVRLLLEHGAFVRALCQGGWSALATAAFGGHVEIVRHLLDHGAEVMPKIESIYDMPDYLYVDELDMAALRGHEAIAECLIEKGATVTLECLLDAVMAEQDGVLPILLEHFDGNLDKPSGFWRDEQKVLLHEAARKGNPGLVRLLLQAGASVTTRDNYGGTCLHTAAGSGSVEVVKMLLDAGADPNVVSGGYGRGFRGQPLVSAAAKGHVDVVQLLLESGTSVKGDKGHYALIAASSRPNNRGVLQLLYRAGAEHTRAYIHEVETLYNL